MKIFAQSDDDNDELIEDDIIIINSNSNDSIVIHASSSNEEEEDDDDDDDDDDMDEDEEEKGTERLIQIDDVNNATKLLEGYCIVFERETEYHQLELVDLKTVGTQRWDLANLEQMHDNDELIED